MTKRKADTQTETTEAPAATTEPKSTETAAAPAAPVEVVPESAPAIDDGTRPEPPAAEPSDTVELPELMKDPYAPGSDADTSPSAWEATESVRLGQANDFKLIAKSVDDGRVRKTYGLEVPSVGVLVQVEVGDRFGAALSMPVMVHGTTLAPQADGTHRLVAAKRR